MRTYLLTSANAAVVFITLLGCSPVTPAPQPKVTPQPVKLFTVSHNDVQRYRDFPAVVEAAQVAQLAFRVGGEVNTFPMKAGDEIKQGQIVATLDPTDYQLVVDQAQARFDLAQAQFTRTENLVDQGVISPQQFDEVKANLDIARANLDTARSNQGYTQLKAPFAGTIAHVFVERFETVQPQQPIATLQMNDAIDVSINVPEDLFSRVRRNADYQPDVIFSSNPTQSYAATLKEWDATADPATNSYKVVFTLATPTRFNVLPGMSASVRVDLQAVAENVIQAPLIPPSAIFSPAETAASTSAAVWVYDERSQQVSLRRVELGRVTANGIEVTSGLSVGEQIVTAGVHTLEAGQRVRAWVKEPGL